MQAREVKIFFKYDEKLDGLYEVESMWATANEDNYVIDNIPFYVKGIACGDLVSAAPAVTGELWFVRLVLPSGHSTVRLLFKQKADVQRVREEFRQLRCESDSVTFPFLSPSTFRQTLIITISNKGWTTTKLPTCLNMRKAVSDNPEKS